MQIYARATGQVRCVTCVEFNLYCTMLKQFHTSLTVMPSRVEGEPFKLVPQSGELSFILSNVKSLLSKVEVLETVLRSSFITMAFITETWLSETIHDSAVAFDGYSLELISWMEACVHILNHLFHLKYYKIYKTSISNHYGYI